MNETARDMALPEEQAKRQTSAVILDAAFRILARDGFQALTARNVATEAGTNLALVNYYFGGKKGLLLALYDHLETQRFERQTALYADANEPLSVKWRQAVEYYKRDLDEGFVRVHHELLAQGFADDELAERARRRISNWSSMLTQVADTYLGDLGVTVPPAQLVAVFAAFWYGMEQQHLIGMPESESPFFGVLGSIGSWLETTEQAARAAAGETED
ncbi:MAG TPA: TetR/AcrR family transcriptional regulator [Trueperaceae bacterium]|nr:TetR/AcrR family transcriptional regulator [Trueperaceae bacterium]